jgi:ubiquitin C-terminal hydrolase
MEAKNYNLDYVPEPFGFRNLGATCYFNSLLQSIISCPIFIKTLIKNKEADDYKDNPVVQSMMQMHIVMSDPDTSAKDKSKFFLDLAPTVWRDVFTKAMTRKDHIKFTPGQECAREGFHLFLESLDGLSEIQNLFLHRYQTLIFCHDCNDWVVNKECEYSLFEVQPNLISPQLSRFKEIDPNYNKVRPLEDFLHKQTSYVDEFHRCPKCKKAESRYQITRLTMIPEILVVLSKKYDMRGQRKSHEVTNFPDVMKFGGKEEKEGKMHEFTLNYKAVSRIEHMGSMGGGHYNCHSIRKDGKWYLLDDSRVGPGEFKPTSNTYLVFYHVQ